MEVEKKVIGTLEKCYSIAPLIYQGKRRILVAAEKNARCILFDSDGNEVDTVWDQPGGTMAMVQVPGTNGQFLATHKFYSPNDSKEAKIVIVEPRETGGWEARTLVALPHVHRFDILERGGVRYLIACTLKSGHGYRDDWSSPGKAYAAVLPEDLSSYGEGHPLALEVVKENLGKNHGYYQVAENGIPTSVVSAENGVFQFFPPERLGADWEIRQLLDVPASDAVLLDLDQDGANELAVIEPFHGAQVSIYKQVDGKFEKSYQYGHPTEFAHAMFGGMLGGKPVLVIGHRQGKRDLLAFSWDVAAGTYRAEAIDRDCGSANVYQYTHEGKEILISANREIDEIAMYVIHR